MKTIFSYMTFLYALLAAVSIFGQPRPVGSTQEKKIAPAPETFSARYEGGYIGYNKKQDGTLKFDEDGKRLVFFAETGKELFWFPYNSIFVIYPDEKSVTSNTGNVIRAIPLPGAGLGGLIKEKRRYLVIQFEDPDTGGQGVCSFRTENADLLESVIQTLATKAKLVQRGEAFYRPRQMEKQPN